jgi:hypothetical protein
MTANRLVPLGLVVMMMAMEACAGRLQRAEAQHRDSGSLYVIYLLQLGGFGAAFGLWGSHRTPGPWPKGSASPIAPT